MDPSNNCPKNSFPKASRLLSRRDFTAISMRGQHFVGKSLLFQWRRTGFSSARLGIIVTKKFGNAVVRNRFKRLAREAFRLHHPKNLGVDFTIRPRKNGVLVPFSAFIEDVIAFFSTLK